MAKLTQRTLEAIRPDQAGTTVREEGGLFGRVRVKADATITVSFYYRYRFGASLKDFSCGTWPADSLSTIRAARDGARAKVADGIDPAADKKLARHERHEAMTAQLAEIEAKRVADLTIRDMFNAWIVDGVRRKDGNAALIRLFNADILPTIGSIAVRNATEHDIRGVLRMLVDRGVNRTAVIARDSLTQMFAWGQKRQPWRKLMAEGNPMDLIEIEKIVDPDYDMDNQSDRVLSPGEIVELRDALRRGMDEYANAPNKRRAPQPVEKTTQRAIWIMLSTLCRVGELSMARWEHVDLEAGEWFIPKENVKNSLADLLVYLSPFARDQFVQLYEVTGKTEWCYPAVGAKTHIGTKSMTKQIGDRQAMFKKDKDGKPATAMKKRRSDNSLVLANGKNGNWTPHDLRRTGATMMQALGVPLDTIDRCQNHVLSGSKVRRHYLRHDYAREKRDAWCLLGAKLSEILQPAGDAPNVVPIGRAAA